MRQAADSPPFVTAAAVVTEDAASGVPSWSLALHTPIQLAKALATIDQISGGRVIAGMGTGWSTDEFQAAGATRADVAASSTRHWTSSMPCGGPTR